MAGRAWPHWSAFAAFVAVTQAEAAERRDTDNARAWDLRRLRPEDRSAKSTIDFRAKTTEPTDIIVQQHDFLPGGSTGWHHHPGPVFITVTQGTLTFYELDDPTCTPHVVTVGQGYVDTGDGHIGRNETNAPAQDVAVAIAPVGAPFRTELDAPGPYCNF